MTNPARREGGQKFPCAALAEALTHLRRPSIQEAIHFKVQHVADRAALVVAYLDARFVFDRLDQVCGGEWSARFDALPERLIPVRSADNDGLSLIYVRCRLTIFGVTREDVGEGENPKAAFSDAIKRAAVHFGVGRALYALRLPWMREGEADGELRRNRAGKLVLDRRSEAWCRVQYGRWLRNWGIRQFGEPLDHRAGAQGLGAVADRPEAARLDLRQIERARRAGGYRQDTVGRLAVALYQQPDVDRLTAPQTADLGQVLEHAGQGGISERTLVRCLDRLERKSATERPLALRAFREYLTRRASETKTRGQEAA